MAAKNIFKNLASQDTSYLLDPSLSKPNETDIEVGSGKKSEKTLPIDTLVPFKDHPFHIDTEDEAFKQLLESIEENGVIYPILVRPLADEKDKYEIVAGHCRVEACKQLGIEEIPAKVQEMDDLLATVIMTHTNISGRDKISVSEKAKAYRMCMDLEKHQGINKGEETASVIGAGKDSTRQVYRYVRLSYLLPEFLDLIDAGKIAMQVGNEIAYISEEGQKALYRFIDDFKQLPTLEQAQVLRKIDTERELSYERVVGCLARPPVKKTVNKVSFKTKDLADYFEDDTDAEEMESVILKLLEMYKAGDIEI